MAYDLLRVKLSISKGIKANHSSNYNTWEGGHRSDANNDDTELPFNKPKCDRNFSEIVLLPFGNLALK